MIPQYLFRFSFPRPPRHAARGQREPCEILAGHSPRAQSRAGARGLGAHWEAGGRGLGRFRVAAPAVPEQTGSGRPGLSGRRGESGKGRTLPGSLGPGGPGVALLLESRDPLGSVLAMAFKLAGAAQRSRGLGRVGRRSDPCLIGPFPGTLRPPRDDGSGHGAARLPPPSYDSRMRRDASPQVAPEGGPTGRVHCCPGPKGNSERRARAPPRRDPNSDLSAQIFRPGPIGRAGARLCGGPGSRGFLQLMTLGLRIPVRLVCCAWADATDAAVLSRVAAAATSRAAARRCPGVSASRAGGSMSNGKHAGQLRSESSSSTWPASRLPPCRACRYHYMDITIS